MPIDLSKPYTAEDFGASFQPKPTTPIQFPGVSQEPIMNSLSAPPPPAEDPDIAEIMAIMKPETRLQSQYEALLKEQPQRKEPGWGTRIIAGLGTLQQGPEGSQAAAEQYRYQPYYQQMEGFNKKEAILKDLSDNERQANVNNRQIGATLLTNVRAQKRLEEQNRANIAREQNNTAVTQIKRELELNPNLESEFKADGTLILYDRKSGKITDTGIKGQSLNDWQKLILTNSGQAARDALNNQAAEELARQKAEYDRQLAELRAQLAAKAEKEKGLSPSENKVREFSVAQRYFNTDWRAKKFLTINQEGANTFRIKKPEEIPGFWQYLGTNVQEENRLLAEKYIEVARAIYGQDVAIPQSVKDAAAKGKPPAEKPSTRSQGAGPGAGPVNSGKTSGTTTRPTDVPSNYIRILEKASKRYAWIDPAQFNAAQHEKAQ